MTNEDIISMAREAADKDKVDPYQNDFWTLTTEELTRFAAFVAAKERERLRPIMYELMGEYWDILMGEYWDIAFAEGCDEIRQGSQANDVMHRLNEALDAR